MLFPQLFGFSSFISVIVVVQSPSHVWLCNPMGWSMPALPVPHHLPKFPQVHFHCISDAIQPSHALNTLFSFCLQSLPASGNFPMSWLFALFDQNISFSISPSNEYSGLTSFKIDWFDLQGTHRSLLQSSLVQRHQFFGALPSLQSSSHNCMWPSGRP